MSVEMAFRVFLFKYSQPLAIGTIVCGWAASLAGQQYLADYSVWRSTLFVHGQEVKLTEPTLRLFSETKQKMQSTVNCEPFIADSCNPFVISAMSGTAYLGFPFNINYRNPSDVPMESLQFARENLQLSIDHPRRSEIVATLVMSENAKRFLFARQIIYAESHRYLVSSSVTAVSAYLGYLSTYFVNRSLFVVPSRFPLLFRAATYSLLIFCAAFLRLSILSQYTLKLDAKADRIAASLGVDFARGGVDFYNNQVQRNLLYRSLFKTESLADSYFTRLGNECPGSFSVYGMLLRQRLNSLQKLLEKTNSE